MARDDDPWKRMREREDERDAEEAASQQSLSQKRKAANAAELAPPVIKPGSIDMSTEKLLETLKLVEPMIEQVNNLYNQYIAGVEKRPPVERRKQLDNFMSVIQNIAKPTQGLMFKCNTLLAHYQAHKDRWERMLRDLEKGARKRSG
jgi:hypothetical protein